MGKRSSNEVLNTSSSSTPGHVRKKCITPTTPAHGSILKGLGATRASNSTSNITPLPTEWTKLSSSSRKAVGGNTHKSCCCKQTWCHEMRNRIYDLDPSQIIFFQIPRLKATGTAFENEVRAMWLSLCKLKESDLSENPKSNMLGGWHFPPYLLTLYRERKSKAEQLGKSVIFSNMEFTSSDVENLIETSLYSELLRFRNPTKALRYMPAPIMSRQNVDANITLIEHMYKVDREFEETGKSSSNAAEIRGIDSVKELELTRENGQLRDMWAQERKEREALRKELDKVVKENEMFQLDNEMLKVQLSDRIPNLGLNRACLTSDEWHRKNPEAANHLFGLGTWGETLLLCWVLWPEIERPKIPGDKLSKFENLLITKMRFRRGYDEQSLALMMGVQQPRINKIISETSPLWGEAGRDFSNLDVTKEYIDYECPQSYRDAGFVGPEKIFALVDGKDFMCETHRIYSFFKKQQYSDKMKHSAFRTMTWTTPKGLTFQHTPLYLAKATESALVELWASKFGNIAAGYGILADRGFANDQQLYPNWNRIYTPCFLDKRERFTNAELVRDIRICQLRYTSETVFARVTDEKIISGIISRGVWRIADDVNDWGHGHINLLKPMQK